MKVWQTIEASDGYDHQKPSEHFSNVECGSVEGGESLFFTKDPNSFHDVHRSQLTSVAIDDNEAINWINNDVDQQHDIDDAVVDVPRRSEEA